MKRFECVDISSKTMKSFAILLTLAVLAVGASANGVCYCHCCQDINTYDSCTSYIAGSFDSDDGSDCTDYQCYADYPSDCPNPFSSTGQNYVEYDAYVVTTGTIVGSVIGSLLFICCIVAIIISCRARQQQQLLLVGGAMAGNPYAGLNNNGMSQQQQGYYQQQQPGYYQPPPMGQQQQQYQQQQPQYPAAQAAAVPAATQAPAAANPNTNVPRI